MRKNICLVLVLLLALVCGAVYAEEDSGEVPTFATADEAVAYLQDNQPTVLKLEGKKVTLDSVVQVKQAMPEGSELLFSVTLKGSKVNLTVTNETE